MRFCTALRITPGISPASLLTAILIVCVLGLSQAHAQSVAWIQHDVTGPSARGYSAIVYDSDRRVSVLFGGGIYDVGVLGETWEWDGTVWTQQPVTGPSPRDAFGMAYDSARHVTVLFGGSTGSLNGETWEWNGTVWTQQFVSGPAPRDSFAMAFDSSRGVTVLFGGKTGTTIASFSSETWEWNGYIWTLRATSLPSPREDYAMAYDSARGVTVLFGGYTSAGTNGETWEWNGITWIQRCIVCGLPARDAPTMAFDSFRGVTVLFGGNTAVSPYPPTDETWEWNGTSWTQRPLTGPSPRRLHAMAFDSRRRATVLFGGITADNNAANGETWELFTCGTSDFDGDGDFGTDADIESFFACLGGNCCATCFADGSDFNRDGDFGTDADIESFFRVLAGGNC